MILEVMVREGYNRLGKQMVNNYRYHDSQLSYVIRNMQNMGVYITGVTPLFRDKSKDVVQKYVDDMLNEVDPEHVD